MAYDVFMIGLFVVGLVALVFEFVDSCKILKG